MDRTRMDLMETRTAWSRALRDPALRDLPYKIETNEYGQLVMSPLKPLHGRIQARLASMLDGLAEGVAAVEFAVETSMGVKVPDVIWISEARWQTIPRDAEASPISAEICIEVISKSNTRAEIDMKRRLYLDHGAEEVWTCDLKGRVRFFDRSEERPSSKLHASFPTKLEI